MRCAAQAISPRASTIAFLSPLHLSRRATDVSLSRRYPPYGELECRYHLIRWYTLFTDTEE
jgi:hypothetical protein